MTLSAAESHAEAIPANHKAGFRKRVLVYRLRRSVKDAVTESNVTISTRMTMDVVGLR
jgi:hypothetical protein